MSARAIILAAGRGSRMGVLGGERPKCLVEVGGRTLLQRQLDALRDCAIEDIAIVTGYRREMVALPGLTEFHNERWAQTNMVASLACASGWLRAAKCIVSYADIFYEPSAVESLLRCPASLAVTYGAHWRALWACRFDDPLSDAETFRLHPDGTLAEIGGSAVSLDAIEGQYMGLLGFDPAGWSEVERIRGALPAGERDRMHMTATLQRVLDAGAIAIAALRYEGDWGEVDSPRDLALYAHGK